MASEENVQGENENIGRRRANGSDSRENRSRGDEKRMRTFGGGGSAWGGGAGKKKRVRGGEMKADLP